MDFAMREDDDCPHALGCRHTRKIHVESRDEILKTILVERPSVVKRGFRGNFPG